MHSQHVSMLRIDQACLELVLAYNSQYNIEAMFHILSNAFFDVFSI